MTKSQEEVHCTPDNDATAQNPTFSGIEHVLSWYWELWTWFGGGMLPPRIDGRLFGIERQTFLR